MSSIFIDDFTTDSIGAGQWTLTEGPAGNWVVAGGVLTHASSGVVSSLRRVGLAQADLSYGWKEKYSATVTASHLMRFRIIDTSNYLCVRMRTSTGNQQILKDDATVFTTLATAAAPSFTAGGVYWGLVVAQGNVITFTTWGDVDGVTPPWYVSGQTPIATITTTLTGATATKFGAVAGSVAVSQTLSPVTPTDQTIDHIEVTDLAAPVNSSAPSIATDGTPQESETVTAVTGAWTGTVTGKTYQWQDDVSGSYTDVLGATNPTYLLTNPEVGHHVRLGQRAQNNGVFSAFTYSTPITVLSAAAPSFPNTPAITPAGPYHTGDVVHCDDGGVVNATSVTYQWYRVATAETGETSANHTLIVAEEGANVFCRVTAVGPGGTTTADSNTIVPVVSAPLSDASFLAYYSGGTGNAIPANSTGGARGATLPTGPLQLDAVFGPVPGSIAQVGGHLYAGVFIRNTSTVHPALGGKLFIEQQFTDAGLAIKAAVPAEAVNVALATLTDRTTPPAGRTFTSATTAGAGQDFGDLQPGDFRGVWLELDIAPGTAPDLAGNYFSVVVEVSSG